MRSFYCPQDLDTFFVWRFHISRLGMIIEILEDPISSSFRTLPEPVAASGQQRACAVLLALFFLPLTTVAEQVRIAVGMGRDEAIASITKHGGRDMTPELAVIGPKGEWGLKGIYWAFRDYDAVIAWSANDGKVAGLSFWKKKDFGESKSHRAESEQAINALTIDTNSREVSIEKKTSDSKATRRISEDEKIWRDLMFRRNEMIRVTTAPYHVQWAGTILCNRPSGLAHTPHGEHWIHVFVSPSGTNAMTTGKTAYPEGTIVLKQKSLDPAGTKTDFYTGMHKRERGYNPELGDWEFFTLDTSGFTVTARGKIDSCYGVPRQMEKDRLRLPAVLDDD